MPNVASALLALCPGAQWTLDGDDYSGLTWLDTKQAKPSFDQVQDEITTQVLQQPFNDCKTKAKELIAATDWAVLSDTGLANKSEFVAYRATLRELIINPVADPQWPTEPQPIWS